MHLGFAEVFLELRELIPSPTARWSYCFRCKRGLRDTQVPVSLLQRVAVCCSVLQCVAVCCCGVMVVLFLL